MLSAVVRLQDWFLPEAARDDPDLRRRASSFVWSNLAGPPTGVALLLFLYSRDPHPPDWYAMVGCSMPLFFLFPLALKVTRRFDLLSFVSAQLFGALVLFLVCIFGGVQNSPFTPWFIAVVMTGCFYFGVKPKLRNPFLASTAAEIAIVYALSLFEGPFPVPLPPELMSELGIASDFCLVVFMTALTLNFVRVVHTQQTVLETEVATRRQTETKLVEALTEAQQAVRSKATFLANTSHELRTPLNAIIGFSDLMRGETFGPVGNARYRGYLDDIAASGQLLLRIINDILDFSKFEAGKATLEHEEPVDLGALIGAASRMVQRQAEGAQINLAADIEPRLPPVVGNERLLSQVLLNLLSNAIKFTPADGSITVRAGHAADGGVTIAVADTGIGMSEDDMKIAFSAFGQVDSNLARRFPGTGLGLPLAKAIVELHRGQLLLRSAPGCGTEATILLPPDRVLAAA